MYKYKLIKKVTLVTFAMLTLYLGALLHIPILSIFDGVYEIEDIRKTPTGFKVSPWEAELIVLAHHKVVFCGIDTGSIYADYKFYYLPLSSSFIQPTYHDIYYGIWCFDNFSYYAKTRGYKIDGQTGELVHLGGSHKVGVTLLSTQDLNQRFEAGTSRKEILETIGQPYESRDVQSDILEWHKLQICDEH